MNPRFTYMYFKSFLRLSTLYKNDIITICNLFYEYIVGLFISKIQIINVAWILAYLIYKNDNKRFHYGNEKEYKII